jgi:hypothetical protein
VLDLAPGVVRMARRCRQWTAKVRVAGSKVTIGLIGGAGERAVVGGVRVVVDMMAVGDREDLEVVGVARGGVDRAEFVGVDVTESQYIICSWSRILGARIAKGNRIYCRDMVHKMASVRKGTKATNTGNCDLHGHALQQLLSAALVLLLPQMLILHLRLP